MGKGGARLVTTRGRLFSVSEGDTADAVALHREISSPLDVSGGDAKKRLSQAKRATAFCVERANAILYLACAASFVPASLGFLKQFKEYYELSVWVFIVGSVGFTWVAGCDAQETLKLHRELQATTNGSELWQLVNAAMYVVGSVLFVVGSVLFLPGASNDDKTEGALMFIAGSVAFTLASLLNVTEVRRNTELDVEQAKLVITVLYSMGGLLFIVGSAFCLPVLHETMGCVCLEDAAAWIFLVGSFLYFGAAVLNIRKIGLQEAGFEARCDTMGAAQGLGGAFGHEGNLLGRFSVVQPTAETSDQASMHALLRESPDGLDGNGMPQGQLSGDPPSATKGVAPGTAANAESDETVVGALAQPV